MHSDIMEIKTIFYIQYRNQTARMRQQDLSQSQFSSSKTDALYVHPASLFPQCDTNTYLLRA